MTIQKLFCKIVPWVCVLIPGLIPITELSANPRFEYTVNDLSEAVSAPQERGRIRFPHGRNAVAIY